MGSEREVIIEIMTVGRIAKVSAIDPVTLIEVSIQGPADTPEFMLRRTAIAKLDYVLRKRRPPDATSRGLIV